MTGKHIKSAKPLSHSLLEGFQSSPQKPAYKMKYPGKDSYGFGAKCPLSPCMSSYWRSLPIRAGKKRQDPEHDEKPEEPEGPEEETDETRTRAEYAQEIRIILKGGII